MAELLVADSFRVREHPSTRDAEVRGLHLHLDRFIRSAREAAAEHGGRLDGLEAFIDRARVDIAAAGAGFPRLELRIDAAGSTDRSEASAPERIAPHPEPPLSLALALRPLPELRSTISLRSASGIGLTHPQRKGPNIERLGALNRRLGAEALLFDAEGFAVEGATTSLVWWEGSVLCTSGTTERVASVTERILLDAATGLGISTAPAARLPGELSRHEVWAVNALHGIRVAVDIDGTPLPAPDAPRLRGFLEALDASWRPVTGV